jgi:hypothetical protein
VFAAGEKKKYLLDTQRVKMYHPTLKQELKFKQNRIEKVKTQKQ